MEEVNSEDKARAINKAPVVLTRYLLEWLSQSVGQCIRNSSSLTHLELEGIPFPPDCIAVLCVGLSGTETLHYLSLRRCYIGDTGCELICRIIADIRSVKTLNLSHCNLTSTSGSVLASALSRQKLTLYHDTWKQSLRYRDPNFETMPGLRRLTLNDNPHLGNCAVKEVIEAIRDSLWMKALDLQHCGLTDQIGTDLLNLLDQNNTLSVLDVRKNTNLNEELAVEIMRKLEENVGGKSEYKWLGLVPKDQRITSADIQRDSEKDVTKISRSQSAFIRYTRRPFLAIPTRRTVPLPILRTKPKIRSDSLSFHDVIQQRNLRPRTMDSIQPTSKISLHLDLQSHIQSTTNHVSHKNAMQYSTETSLKSLDSSKVDVGTQSQHDDSEEIHNILRQLTKAQEEHDKLLEKTKCIDRMLIEERTRREHAEINLRSAQNDIVEMENALKKKESETRDYLLISQQSLNEISLSFDCLLQLLENVVANYPFDKTQNTQRITTSADIKQHLASVIKQTKSENLKQSYKVNIKAPRYSVMDSARKFVKSESDVRSTLPISTIHLERKIGEYPDENEPHYRHCDTNKPISPSNRARAIFAGIVTSETMLHLY